MKEVVASQRFNNVEDITITIVQLTTQKVCSVINSNMNSSYVWRSPLAINHDHKFEIFDY